jgi:hypothetical protein
MPFPSSQQYDQFVKNSLEQKVPTDSEKTHWVHISDEAIRGVTVSEVLQVELSVFHHLPNCKAQAYMLYYERKESPIWGLRATIEKFFANRHARTSHAQNPQS